MSHHSCVHPASLRPTDRHRPPDCKRTSGYRSVHVNTRQPRQPDHRLKASTSDFDHARERREHARIQDRYAESLDPTDTTDRHMSPLTEWKKIVAPTQSLHPSPPPPRHVISTLPVKIRRRRPDTRSEYIRAGHHPPLALPSPPSLSDCVSCVATRYRLVTWMCVCGWGAVDADEERRPVSQ